MLQYKIILVNLLFICSLPTKYVLGQHQVDRAIDTAEANKAKATVEKFITTLLKDTNDTLINTMSIPFTVIDGANVYQANSKDSLSTSLSQMELILRENNCLNVISCNLFNSYRDDNEHELYFFTLTLDNGSEQNIKMTAGIQMFKKPLLFYFSNKTD